MMRTAVILGAIALSATPIAASAAKPAPLGQCFRSEDYQDFKAINDHSFYMRALPDQVFRIDLVGTCPYLTAADARLITVVHGSTQICNKLDWDLRVAESPPSPAIGCIVDKQTRLTPEEVAAIPPKLKP
jgi:hypothetical protein